MLADLWLGFQGVYLLMAGFAVVFAVIAAIAPEPTQAPAPRSLVLAVVEPFQEFSAGPAPCFFF